MITQLFTLWIAWMLGEAILYAIDNTRQRAALVRKLFGTVALLTLLQPMFSLRDDFHSLAQTGQGLSELAQAINGTAEKTSGIFDFGASKKPLSNNILDVFTGGKFSLPARGDITKGFGTDNHGLDIAAAEGDPVQVAKDGTVKAIAHDDIYGINILVDHGQNYQTLYAHLSAVSVKTGEAVFEKDVIAKVGNTGNSKGPHLHFEIRYKGQAVDPAKYLRGK